MLAGLSALLAPAQPQAPTAASTLSAAVPLPTIDARLRAAVPGKLGPDLFGMLGSDLPIQRVWQDGPYLWVVQREPVDGQATGGRFGRHIVHQDVIQVIDLSKWGSPRRVQTLRPLADAIGLVSLPTEGTHGMELGTVFLREGWLYAQDRSSFVPRASYYTYRRQTDGSFVFSGMRALESSDTSTAPLETVTSRMYPAGGEMFVEGKVYSTSALSNLGLPLSDGYLFSRHRIDQGTLQLGFPKSPGTQGVGYSSLVAEAGLPENQALGATPARKIHDAMLFFRNAPEWPMFDHAGSASLTGGEDGRPRAITYEWIELTKPLHTSPLSTRLMGFVPEANLHVPMSRIVAGMVPRNERLSQTLDLKGLLLDAVPARNQALIDFLRRSPDFDENLDLCLRRVDIDRQATVREALRALSLRHLETRLEAVLEGYFNRVFAELSLEKVIGGTLAIGDVAQRVATLSHRLKEHFDTLEIDDFVVDHVFRGLIADLPFADDSVRDFVDRLGRSGIGLFIDGMIRFINLNPAIFGVELLVGCDFPDDLPALARSLMKHWGDGIVIDWDNRIYYEGIKVAAHYSGFEGFPRFEVACRERLQEHLLEVQTGVFGAIDPFVAKIEGWSGLRKSFAVGFYNKKLLCLVADLVADGVGAVLSAKTRDVAILDRTVAEVIARFGLESEGDRLTFDRILSVTDLGSFLTTPLDTLFDGLDLDLGKLGYQQVIEGVVIDHFRKTFPELNLNLSLHDNLMDYLLRAMDFSRITQQLVHEVLGRHFDDRLGGGSEAFRGFMQRFQEELLPYRSGDECWMNVIRMSRWLRGLLGASPDPSGISLGVAIDLAAIERAAETAVTASIEATIREAVGQYVAAVVSDVLSGAGSVNTTFSAEARRSVARVTETLEEQLAPYRGRPVQHLGSHGRGDQIVSLLQALGGETPEFLRLTYDRVTRRHEVQVLGNPTGTGVRALASVDDPNPRLSQGFLALGSSGTLTGLPHGLFAVDALSGHAVFFKGADWNAERFIVSPERERVVIWSARRLQVGLLPLWNGMDSEERHRAAAPVIGATPSEVSFEPGERLTLGIPVRGIRPMAFFWKDGAGRVIAQGTNGFDARPDASWPEGVYRLMATNAVGLSESAPLRLSRRPAAWTELSLGVDGSWIRAFEGRALEIPVTGHTNQRPLRYTLNLGGKVLLATTNRTLRISSLTRAHSGRFTVQAEGPEGKRTLGAFTLTVVPDFKLPEGFRPTFTTPTELGQVSRLFDRVEATDPRTGITRGYSISRESLPPYDRTAPSRYQGFIGDRAYPFIDRVPPGGPRPLAGRMLGTNVVKMSVGPADDRRWVLQKSASLEGFTPVHSGRGSAEFLLPTEGDQGFYRIDTVP